MARAPLYRLQGHGDHFYTTSASERDAAIAQYGYVSEGIACYVETEEATAPPALTLRDQIAISAMSMIRPVFTMKDGEQDARARTAYQMADAMLRAR